MNRKYISSLPFKQISQRGKRERMVTARVIEDTLVLDCYKSGKPIGRYCINPAGKYDTFLLSAQSWRRIKLSVLYGDYWYWNCMNDQTDITPEDEGIIRDYIADNVLHTCKNYRPPVFSEIETMESDYNGEKREAAYMRKKERINSLMDRIPLLSEDFYHWCNEVLFQEEYMFRIGEGIWNCTACGRTHTSKEPLKHNSIKICSRTGKEVTVKNRVEGITKKEPVMVLQVIDELQSTARHFVVEKYWNRNGGKITAYENVRYILGRGQDIGKVSWYYGQRNKADELEQEWWDTNLKNKRCNSEYCYPAGAAEALKGTVYQNAHLEALIDKGWKMQYNKLMIAHDRCGFMEYLAKANLGKLAGEASENFSIWYGGYYGTLNPNGETAREVLGVDMQRFHRLKQSNGGYRYLKWLKWEEENGRNLPEQVIQWLDKNGLDPNDIAFIKGRMTPVQVMNYLEKQSKESKKTAHSLLGYWKDYLSMANRCGMDETDEIVYRTKHLLQRHDELVELINQQSEDAQADKMREKYPEVEHICAEIKERYMYENNKYLLVIPARINDIMWDGRSLHHCAASSERYFERINRQETYIMFLRKKDRPLSPWYTLEVEPGGTVRQKRSEYNRQPELEAVEKFIKEWQQELKKRMKEKDKNMAAYSREMRLAEMAELRKNNSTFAQVLGKDLMEVG